MPDPSHLTTNSRPIAERRRNVRISCAAFAEGISVGPSRLFRGELQNVSDSGCFISTRAAIDIPSNTIVDLRFNLAGIRYSALAGVVEALPTGGIRMRFLATDPAFSDRIRRILGARSPKP